MRIDFDHIGRRKEGVPSHVAGLGIIVTCHGEGRVENLLVTRDMAADPRDWDKAFEALGGSQDLIDEDGDRI